MRGTGPIDRDVHEAVYPDAAAPPGPDRDFTGGQPLDATVVDGGRAVAHV